MRAVPRSHTPRDPNVPTLGGLVAIAAEYRGKPLLPWQRRAWDVICELRPDGKPGWRRPFWVITTPRQVGKTEGLRSHDVAICTAMPGIQCLYTAQTGKDARARWIDTVDGLRGDPATAQFWRINVGNQSPAARSVNSGSLFTYFSPGPDCVHGWSPDIVKVDEAFAHSDAMGALLMGAIQPAQQTRPWRQLLIISTRGAYGMSPFLESWISRAESDTTGRVGIIDYGAPAGAPTFDEETWLDTHPGLGTPLLDLDTIWDAAVTMTRAEFERAYLNRSILDSAGLLTSEEWERVERDVPVAIPSRCILGVEVAHGGVSADIVASWPKSDPPAPTMSALLQHEPGTEWLAAALRWWCSVLRPSAVRIMGTGASQAVAGDLAAAQVGAPVEIASEGDLADATTSWLTAVRRGGLVVHGHPLLTSAATACDLAAGRTRRPLDRERARVSPVIAHALAHTRASRLRIADDMPAMWLPGSNS